MSEHDRRSRRGHRSTGSIVGIVCAIVTIVVGATGCGSEPSAGVDPADYVARMSAVCDAARQGMAELAEPQDEAGVAGFARDVAALLAREADGFRAVTPPSDVAADHRALVQNTDEQARRWTSLSSTPPQEVTAFGDLQTEILELSLGRDDLATEMGVDACRRSAP